MTLKINDNGVDRDMTEAEIALFTEARNAIQNEENAQAQIEANRQALKEATLAKLGLTADEVAALLS